MVEHEGQWALLYVGPRGLSVVRFSSNYGFQAESHITRFNYTPVILLVPFLRPSLPHRPILKVPWDLCGLRPNRSSLITPEENVQSAPFPCVGQRHLIRHSTRMCYPRKTNNEHTQRLRIAELHQFVSSVEFSAHSKIERTDGWLVGWWLSND